MKHKLVICSAIKFGNGMIIKGHRHNDCFRTARGIKALELKEVKNNVQGFITSENKFVKRRTALKIAVKAGQVLKRKENESELLYSEDLY